MPTPAETTAELLDEVLADLARVLEAITAVQVHDPAPCTDYNVGQLRDHVLGWLTNFAAGFADPHGQAPHATVEGYRSPADPAAEVRAAPAGTLIGAIRGGAGTRPLTLGDADMPGEMALGMILWEYLVHGWDLARATGQAWSPSTAAAVRSLGFAPTMLTPDYQGEGKMFAPAVTVAEDAPAIDRLTGLSGRNPSWRPPSRTRDEGLSGSGSVDNRVGATVHVEDYSEQPAATADCLGGRGRGRGTAAGTSPGQSNLLSDGGEVGDGGWAAMFWTGSDGIAHPMQIVSGFVVLKAPAVVASGSGAANMTTRGRLLHPHAVGLNHSSDPNQVMYPPWPRGNLCRG